MSRIYLHLFGSIDGVGYYCTVGCCTFGTTSTGASCMQRAWQRSIITALDPVDDEKSVLSARHPLTSSHGRANRATSCRP